MATAANLQVLVGADISGALSGFKTMNRTIAGAGSLFTQAAGTALGFTAAALGIGAITNVASSANAAIFGMNSNLEQQAISFRTLLGSGDKANAMLADLQKFANTTDFSFPQVVSGAQRLLGAGVAAEKIIPLLRDVGGTAAAFGAGGEGVDRITRALQQMAGIGVVQLGEINQLSELGINGLQILADHTGKSVAEIRKSLEKGEIGASTFFDAFQANARRKGFDKVLAEQATTAKGAFSTIQDVFVQGTARAFKPLFDASRGAANQLATFLQTPAFEAFVTRTSAAVSSLLQPFQTFATTVQNISRDHGLSIFQSALIATEQQIARTFGPASAAVFNGFQGAARTAFDWFKTNGPSAFEWMKPELVEGFLQHFATFGTTVENISGAHGVGKLRAAFITVEQDLERVFGPNAADLFHAFGDELGKLATRLDTLGKDMTGKTLFDFKLMGDAEMQALEKIAGWMNTIGYWNDRLKGGTMAPGAALVGAAPGAANSVAGAANALGTNARTGIETADRAGSVVADPVGEFINAVDRRVMDVAGWAFPALVPPASPVPARTSTVNVHVSGVIMGSAEEFGQQVADIVEERLAGYEEAALATAGTEGLPGA